MFVYIKNKIINIEGIKSIDVGKLKDTHCIRFVFNDCTYEFVECQDEEEANRYLRGLFIEQIHVKSNKSHYVVVDEIKK